MKKWSESVCTVNVTILRHSLHLSHNIKLSSERREHADTFPVYQVFPVFLLENVKQLTRNSCFKANLVPFCPTFSKR